MTREKLFAFATEKGWNEILEVAYETHSLLGIAVRLKKEEGRLKIELQNMCDMGLLLLTQNKDGKHIYLLTVLGIKFLQEENKKVGRTYSCLLCGTTTGFPHVCPVFDARFKK